jgi:hypothetical protein
VAFAGLLWPHACVLFAGDAGPGKSESDAASIRTDCEIPRQCGVYYFEVFICSKGREGYARATWTSAGWILAHFRLRSPAHVAGTSASASLAPT